MLARSDAPHNEERISHVSPIDSAVSPFELRAGPYEFPALKVISLRGREAISEPFTFEITVAASSDVDDSTIEPDLLGAPACLVMQAGASAPRFVRGVVAEVAAQSAVHGRRAVYRLQVVPALSLLKMQTATRIYQEKTVPEIVAAVLDEAGITYALRLLGKYRPRTYCVQHRETDFAFVERILAEEGIFYAFDHGGPDAESEIVSLSDAAYFYPVIEGDPELAYRPHEGAAGMALDEHHVQRFDLRRSLRPTSVLRRGYDFRRPALALTAEAKLEIVTGGEPTRGEIYEHHEEDEEPNIRQETVNAELEQHRAGVEVGRGASGCRRLVPGARFKLCDHDLGRLDAEYVVTSVAHEGRAPETAAQGEPVYSNTFECVPAAVTARPPRPVRSLQQVTETALVVGPEGQEIYTDEHGRVKVQFHWDREGRRDERSSCWIRVAQAWAGSGWGFEFIPRVGMEVIVTFLGGDVDRPLITGCVPNAINRPPFRLPENKTQSGIRTQSTPGGGGFNELSFQDARGKECVSLRAQRDLDELVLHDHTIRIDGNQCLNVGGAQAETIVAGKCESIGGSLMTSVAGRASSTFQGTRSTTVSGSDSIESGARYELVHANVLSRILGAHSFVVGSEDAPKSSETHTWGTQSVSASGSMTLTADKEIAIRCGKSVLRLTPDGVFISSPSLTLSGDEKVTITGKGPQLKLGAKAELCAESILLYTKHSAIRLDENARVNGQKVLLNCSDVPPPTDGQALAEDLKPVSVKVCDETHVPYAGKHYKLVASGRTYEGTVAADGTVSADVLSETASVNLTVWVDEFPTGRQVHFALNLEKMDDVRSLKGAQARLKNLGYYDGPTSGQADDLTSRALKRFQVTHGLTESGVLDDATVSGLQDLHGH